MADFVSGFWNWFIIVPTVGGLIGCFLLIRWLGGETVQPTEEVETMGHVWDENLEELNNPLPRWWLNLFYITLVFGLVYLLLFPGLGAFPGFLGWTQLTQYEEEVAQADARYSPLYERYSQESIKALGNEPEALAMGERLYASYCTGCHGSDARGARGFPNLADNEWLWGGEPEAIKTSILNGRTAMMPAWDAVLGKDGVKNTAQYVLSLSERKVNAAQAEAGKQPFLTYCAGCHLPTGQGNQAVGAPNLTNNIWLYGGSAEAIEASIAHGRQGKMPAQEQLLGEAKVHLLAAYVYHLSQ